MSTFFVVFNKKVNYTLPRHGFLQQINNLHVLSLIAMLS